MPTRRGFVPPALITSTLGLILCSIGWGALGVISFTEPDTLSIAAHRYLCIMLATLTLGAAMVYLTARIMRAVADAAEAGVPAEATDDGYADGYAAGLAARPEVTRLVPARR